MKIEIEFKNLKGQGFGCFLNNNKKKKKIIIDMNAILNVCNEHEISVQDIFSSTCVHELLHVFEDFYNQTFNDRKIEKLLSKARKEL
jgi:predicted Zn-dependent protease with MMP-like domain